jgi:hypothetical protein
MTQQIGPLDPSGLSATSELMHEIPREVRKEIFLG